MDVALAQHPLLTLFLSACFFLVGAASGSWLLLTRRLVSLTASLSVFALLFGFRFWLLAALPSHRRVVSIVAVHIDYLVAIPAVLLLYQAGIFGRSRIARTAVPILGLFLVIAAAASRSSTVTHRLLNIMVAVSGVALLWSEYRRFAAERKFPADFVGLAVFVVLLVVENLAQLVGSRFGAGSGLLGFAAYVLILAWVVIRRQARDASSLIELQTEVRLARDMQQSLLPNRLPQSAFFQVEARFVPLSHVAGDFYDVVLLDGERCGFFLADVSGHGLAAALIASMVKLAISAHRKHGGNPAHLLTELNQTLCGNTRGSFVTAVYVVCDPIAKKLTFAAAGHPPVLLLRDGAVTDLQENGTILGIFESATFSERIVDLKPKDRIALYTDGLVEAEDRRGEFFGRDGLVNTLQEGAGLPLGEACDHILYAIQRWTPSPNDDQTLLLIECL